jgi:hypothetical protein
MFFIADKKKSIPFLLGMLILFVGLTMSKALTSLVTVYMLLLFLLYKEYKQSWDLVKSNKYLRLFYLFIAWMLVSLLWTNDVNNGLTELTTRLNFILWPVLVVVFSAKIVEFKSLIIKLFTIILLLVSVFQFVRFQNITCYPDIREMTIFVSHIRFALMIDIGICISIYFMLKETKLIVKLGWFIVVCWFLFYTYYSQVLSGLLGITGGIIGGFIYLIFQSKKRYVKIGSLLLMLFFIGFFGVVVVDLTSNSQIQQPSSLPKFTKLGNPYEHKIQSNITENGYYLDLYYCQKEMDSVWELRSNFSVEDLSPRGHQYKYVLKRYLTSKGLTKDAEGVNQLSSADIQNIENGISSITELQTGLKARYESIKYELSGNLDPNGHSVLQRFEFWKASKYIIQHNLIFGVGLGGSKKAFSEAYIKTKSELLPENQWESHNQFLSVWVSFGLVGLVLFISWLVVVLRNALKTSALFTSIFFVLLFSFLVEDTLGTLTGMSLFSFFIGFVMVLNQNKEIKTC